MCRDAAARLQWLKEANVQGNTMHFGAGSRHGP
jgi:hypothetical protein